MAPVDLEARLGPLVLRSPLVAASGTVGSVWEWAEVADVTVYGAAVAKSVSGTPWAGRPAPRLAPVPTGMLNAIGIQNPGIEAWSNEMTGHIARLEVPVWGSAVGETPEEFALVAGGEEAAGVQAVEVNLSCPNLEEGRIFALDPKLSAEVVRAVTERVDIPVGAKLSPAAEDIVAIAQAVRDSGADFVTLTNTLPGLDIDSRSGRPVLSAATGGYSGPGLKPVSLRCVYEVARAVPELAILGCGGVASGRDVLQYMMAGASAVGIGTTHFAEPRAGKRIMRELEREMRRIGVSGLAEVKGWAL